jgi:hypothetical protein
MSQMTRDNLKAGIAALLMGLAYGVVLWVASGA